MGDFNIDLHRLENDSHNKYEELVLINGFYPSISITTHCKPGCRETCIDNIFTNSPDLIVTSGTVDESASHHKPIFLLSKAMIKSKISDANVEPLYYEFSNSNIQQLCSELQSSPQIQNQSITSFSEFIDIFNEKVDKTCKLQKPKTSKRNNKHNPWITEHVIKSIKTKRVLYKAWHKSKSKTNPTGDIKLHNKFSEHRRNLTKSIKRAKALYYNKKINEHEGDLKKTWKIINELRGVHKKPMKPSFIINNERIYERRIIANEFNKHYTSIASNMNETKHQSNPDSIDNNNTYIVISLILNNLHWAVFLSKIVQLKKLLQ